MNTSVKAVLSTLRESSQSEFVFPSSKKKGSHITYIRKAFTTAVKEAGIKNFRFHDLRYTFGTRAADGGVEIVSISGTKPALSGKVFGCRRRVSAVTASGSASLGQLPFRRLRSIFVHRPG